MSDDWSYYKTTNDGHRVNAFGRDENGVYRDRDFNDSSSSTSKKVSSGSIGGNSSGSSSNSGSGFGIFIGLIAALFVLIKIAEFLENNWVSVVIIAGIILACVITCLIFKKLVNVNVLAVKKYKVAMFVSITVSIGLIFGVVFFGMAKGDGNFRQLKKKLVELTASSEVYNVSDKGTAGGIIFYDRGNNFNGWRYLEAAPREAEFQSAWSAIPYIEIASLQANIGSGKRNTERIVKKHTNIFSDEKDSAAKKGSSKPSNLVYVRTIREFAGHHK